MAGKRRYFEFSVFPKYKQMYISAFARMLDELRKTGVNQNWKDEYDVFSWWMEDDGILGQYSFEDYETEENEPEVVWNRFKD